MRPRIVVLNDFIGVRGRSGSSRGATFIATALAQSASVTRLAPKREPASRVRRLAFMIWWDFIRVPVLASVRRGLVVHATNTGGRWFRQRSAVVIHDTMVLDHPDLFDPAFNLYAKVTFAISVRLNSAIVTPSEHSRSRIIARWPSADVSVIPWPAETPNHARRVATGREAVLVVSSVDKHKRLPMAVQVVAQSRQRLGRDLILNLVTREGNDRCALDRALHEYDPDRTWTKEYTGVDDSALSELYETSLCLIVASLDEGYCLPAVEAASRGVPVVHTGRGALPEVTVEAVAPASDHESDLQSLVGQLCRLASCPNAWAEHSDAAIELAKSHSWTAFADRWTRLVDRLAAPS